MNEITSDAELHAYQDDLVRQGLEDIKKGRLIPHEEVVKRFFSK